MSFEAINPIVQQRAAAGFDRASHLSRTPQLALPLGIILASGLLLLLSACSDPLRIASSPGGKTAGSTGASASIGASSYKIGKPYAIKGTWYYPKVNYNYEESGIASWYGKQFHGKKTANGEIFDMEEISAAHRTLPLPSLVRVTNLRNGRTLTVRINDRGPFARGRIIDLSRRAAELLGFERQGTTPVQVRILARESRQMASALGADAPRPPSTPVVAVTTEPLPGITSGVSSAPKPSAAGSKTLTEQGTTLGKTTERVAETAGGTGAGAQSDSKVSITPVAGPPQMFVQVGAFTHFKNARRMQARLSALQPVGITQFKESGKIFFRVRIGPFDDVDTVDRMLAAVLNAGIKARTVIE